MLGAMMYLRSYIYGIPPRVNPLPPSPLNVAPSHHVWLCVCSHPVTGGLPEPGIRYALRQVSKFASSLLFSDFDSVTT